MHFAREIHSIMNIVEKNLLYELIEKDIEITPPGIPIEQKYYIGFFDNDKLVAVMDLVDGYPTCDYVYIGFFMMDCDLQGNGIGSKIVSESLEYNRENPVTGIVYEDAINYLTHRW